MRTARVAKDVDAPNIHYHRISRIMLHFCQASTRKNARRTYKARTHRTSSPRRPCPSDNAPRSTNTDSRSPDWARICFRSSRTNDVLTKRGRRREYICGAGKVQRLVLCTVLHLRHLGQRRYTQDTHKPNNVFVSRCHTQSI